MKKNILIRCSFLFSTTLFVGLSTAGLKKSAEIHNSTTEHYDYKKERNKKINTDDEINKIMNTVEQKTFLGDIYSATNFGDLKSIDVSKLINLDDTEGEIIPAYLKVDGTYTSDIEEAKLSNIKNPVVKYVDNNGISYDSETEAMNAMILDEDSYSNPIAYYEIEDRSGLDKKIYNINPLNINDIEKLKEISYSNAGISGTKFNVLRLKSDGKNYNIENYTGESETILKYNAESLYNELIQIILNSSFFTIINNVFHTDSYGGLFYKDVWTSTPRNYFGLTDSNFADLFKASEKDLQNHKLNDTFITRIDIKCFSIDITQTNFNSYNIDSKANEVYNTVYKKINSYFKSNEDVEMVAKNIADACKEVILTNFLNNNKITTYEQKDFLSAKNLIVAKITGELKNLLNKKFENKKTGYTTVVNYLFSTMKKIFQENYDKNGDNVKYSIGYNGSPLFLIDNSIIEKIKNTNLFKENPVLAIENELLYDSKKNKDWCENAKKLTNVSNTFKYGPNKKIVLNKRDLIDNYNTPNKYSNFKYNNSFNDPSFANIKTISEELYSENNISKNDLEKVLNRREDEDKSLLNNKYGTYEAIYQYNKLLNKYSKIENKSQTIISSVKNNGITDSNDVVFLYNSNKTPETIKFGRYLNYGTKFNVSLTDKTSKIISSYEKLSSEFYIEKVGKPLKQYNFYDYSGKLISQEIINDVNGDYTQSEKNAWENAKKKINISADKNFVYYKNSDSQKFVKNEISKLYICLIPDIQNERFYNLNINKYNLDSNFIGKYYGFTSYDDLNKFVVNYINDIYGVGSIVTPPVISNSTNLFYKDVLIGSWTSFGLIIILTIFSFLYFYNILNVRLNIKCYRNRISNLNLNKKFN